jgi:drug/metabolite transporter (DMT)-like permease
VWRALPSAGPACFVRIMGFPISSIRGRSAPVRAAALMLVANVCVAGMTVAIRIAAAELHPFAIAFFRNLFGLLFLLPFLIPAGLGVIRTHALGRLALSSGGHLIAMLCYFMAAAVMPLAELTALSFTKPLFASIGAALILHEIVRARRWSAIALGLAGVLIVLRPGAEALSGYAGLVLLSALASAVVVLVVKHMTRGEAAMTIVLYQSLLLTVLSLPFALLVWQPPSWHGLALVALIGALGTITWLCFTRAFALADASAVLPLEFLKLPLTALFAYLLFAQVPSLWTWLGGGLIFASTLYVSHREAKVARVRAATAAAGPEPLTAPPARPLA